MKRLLSFSVFLVAVAGQTALATPQPFEGAYVKGAVGATKAEAHVHQNFFVIPANDVFSYSSDKVYADSAAGALGAGYFFQRAMFVGGLEVTAGYTDVTATQSTIYYQNTSGVSTLETKVKTELTNDFALLVKLGVALREQTLAYALIGPRWGNIKTTASIDLTTNVDQSAHGSEHRSAYQVGMTAGLGLQQIITDHVQFGLEYTYTDYGNVDAPNTTADVIDAGAPNGFAFHSEPDVDLRTHTVMLTGAYHW